MEKIRIMTHNQWLCNDNRPAWEAMGMDCSARVRERGFARLYAETAPDIVGIQEISGLMAEELMAALEERDLRYALLWGHDTPILYRQDRFELVDSAFSLYPTALEGHEGSFNNHNSKSRCLGVFRCKESGALLLFVSTHLWWKSDNPSSPNYQYGSGEARRVQLNSTADLIDAFREKYACPAILAGDLNARYTSRAVQSLLERGYAHAHDLATDYADPTRGHHVCGPNGYEVPADPGRFDEAIDHMLIAGAQALTVRRFERYTPDYSYPLSDHSPLFIDVELP